MPPVKYASHVKYAVAASLAALWIFGFVSQFHSIETTLNYGIATGLMVAVARL